MPDHCPTPLPQCIETLARLQEARSDDSQKLDRILRHLEGNGREGLIVRVDRLEQTERRRSKAVWIAAGSVIATAAAAMWKLLAGANP